MPPPKPSPGSPLYALAELYEAFYRKPWKTEAQFAAMDSAGAVLYEHQTYRTLQKEFATWEALNKKDCEHPNERLSPRDRLKIEKRKLASHRFKRQGH